jgi:hypothetical protein
MVATTALPAAERKTCLPPTATVVESTLAALA